LSRGEGGECREAAGSEVELFEAVSGKSKREVEMLLAVRFPRPDAPSRITRSRVEPVSEARFRIEFTASAGLREKLELCRDLLSHTNPSRDLAVVVERAVDLLLAELERSRLGRAKRPRPARPQSKRSGVARAARREVYERDGLQCTYVSADGRRCEARAFLELDHAEPRALGGQDEPANLRVRCRAHNQLAAEQTFGREHVEQRRHFRQRKLSGPQDEKGSEPHDESAGGHHEDGRESRIADERRNGFEKVRQALRTMGFRDTQARRAIAEVEGAHAGRDHPTLEQALREAILVATAPSPGASVLAY
jgi:5-methylcytosine-specific restriction endonuclease McrA